MQQLVNEINSKIVSLGHSVTKNGDILKDGKKIAISPDKFYQNNTKFFEDITPIKFKEIVSVLSESIKNSIPVDMNSIAGLMKQCHFVYCKFRWFVTKEKTKIYYLRTNLEANEYRVLTTDKDSVKFFNSIVGHELGELNRLVAEYNYNNKEGEPMDEEKLVKLIISDIRKNPAYELPAEPIPLTNDPNEPAFRYFDLASIKEKGDKYKLKHHRNPPTPAWDEFFARIRNQQMVPVVKAYLAGLFVAHNRSKQCLYIWGDGNDGKSQITEAITVAMGEDVTFVLDQYMKSNQFSSYDAYGKRLFIGEELSAPNVIKNKTFHAITGNSRIRVEPKGEQAFHTRIYSCGVITSNEKPLIDDVLNQKTRLIYIEVDNVSDELINKSGLEWGDALKKEFAHMIYNGLDDFYRLNPKGSSYHLPTSYKEDDITLRFDMKTEHINEFIEEVFVLDNDAIINHRVRDGFIKFAKEKYFDDDVISLPSEYRDSKIANEIIEKLRTKFPSMKDQNIRVSGTRKRIIKGIGINPDLETSAMKDFFHAG